MINKELAIMSLRPDVEWSMNNDDVENIIWHTPDAKPVTEAEVQAEITRLKKEEQKKELERQKAKESGMKKLKSLGLTDSEIAVLLGN